MNTESSRGKGLALGAPVAAVLVVLLILVGALAYASFSSKQVTSTSSSLIAPGTITSVGSTSAMSTSQSPMASSTSTTTVGSTSATSTNQTSTSYSTSAATSSASASVTTSSAATVTSSSSSSSSSSSAIIAFVAVRVTSIPVAHSDRHVVFDPANGDTYQSNLGNGTVSVISSSTNKVVANVRVGCCWNDEPWTPILDTQNGDIYVPFENDAGLVSVISGATNTVVANVTINEGYYGIFGGVFDPSNGDIYLTDNYVGKVLIISGETNTMVGNITLDLGTFCGPSDENPPNMPCSEAQDAPSLPVFDPANGDIYVSNGDGNTVSVISGATNSLLPNVVVGLSPRTPAFDPSNGYIFVPNGDGTVSIISGVTDTVIETVDLTSVRDSNGNACSGPAVFDPASGNVYVVCSDESASDPPLGDYLITSKASLLNVSTVDSAGTAIRSYYVTLWQNGTQISSCLSECSFVLNDGQTYQVMASSYGSETFSHWANDDSTGAETVEVPTASTTISLIAVYNP